MIILRFPGRTNRLLQAADISGSAANTAVGVASDRLNCSFSNT
jgi:hypothetical protein